MRALARSVAPAPRCVHSGRNPSCGVPVPTADMAWRRGIGAGGLAQPWIDGAYTLNWHNTWIGTALDRHGAWIGTVPGLTRSPDRQSHQNGHCGHTCGLGVGFRCARRGSVRASTSQRRLDRGCVTTPKTAGSKTVGSRTGDSRTAGPKRPGPETGPETTWPRNESPETTGPKRLAGCDWLTRTGRRRLAKNRLTQQRLVQKWLVSVVVRGRGRAGPCLSRACRGQDPGARARGSYPRRELPGAGPRRKPVLERPARRGDRQRAAGVRIWAGLGSVRDPDRSGATSGRRWIRPALDQIGTGSGRDRIRSGPHCAGLGAGPGLRRSKPACWCRRRLG